jgi:lipopolysaccharide export system permease protein
VVAGGTLFIGPNRLGDGVLITGLVEAAARTAPPVTLACGPAALPLFAHTPGIARRIALEKRALALHWMALWSTAIGTSWNRVIDLRGSAIAYALRASKRRVHHPGRGDRHQLTELAATLGLDPPPAPRLWLSEADRAAARRLVPMDRFLALAPTANWPGKIWPAERFAALAEALTGPGGALADAGVVVLGAAGEASLARPVLDRSPRALDLVGRTTVNVAGAVLERARLVVANDSGLMHLAAAAGAPTVGLFGPSRAARYAPWGPRGRAVTTPLPYEALFPPGYDRRTTRSLMTSLPVETVFAACEGLVAAQGAAA